MGSGCLNSRPTCVTYYQCDLTKFLNLSVLPFLHLCISDNKSTYVIGLLLGLTKANICKVLRTVSGTQKTHNTCYTGGVWIVRWCTFGGMRWQSFSSYCWWVLYSSGSRLGQIITIKRFWDGFLLNQNCLISCIPQIPFVFFFNLSFWAAHCQIFNMQSSL